MRSIYGKYTQHALNCCYCFLLEFVYLFATNEIKRTWEVAFSVKCWRTNSDTYLPPPLFFFLTSSAFLVWFSMISVNTTCNCVKTQTTICNCKLSCNECNSYKVKHRPFYVSCFLKKLKGNMRIMKENENHFQCQNGREGMASRLKATNQ